MYTPSPAAHTPMRLPVGCVPSLACVQPPSRASDHGADSPSMLCMRPAPALAPTHSQPAAAHMRKGPYASAPAWHTCYTTNGTISAGAQCGCHDQQVQGQRWRPAWLHPTMCVHALARAPCHQTMQSKGPWHTCCTASGSDQQRQTGQSAEDKGGSWVGGGESHRFGGCVPQPRRRPQGAHRGLVAAAAGVNPLNRRSRRGCGPGA